jgi:lipid-A-disaccharide synthase-like uncharacterized protein
MIENWREWLYPLGYLAQIAFGLRFLQQWLISESKGKSVVTKGFWQISLMGNLLLMIHAFIQLQFHVCILQAGSSIISWRNLNLMQAPVHRFKLQTVLGMMFLAMIAVCSIFIWQGYLFEGGLVEWFRLPAVKGSESISFFWHLIGFTGLILFSSRFWVQWWNAEQQKASNLGPSFWWLSLIGGLLSILYFGYIKDPVNVVGPALGLIPYIRNLILIRKTRLVSNDI